MYCFEFNLKKITSKTLTGVIMKAEDGVFVTFTPRVILAAFNEFELASNA